MKRLIVGVMAVAGMLVLAVPASAANGRFEFMLGADVVSGGGNFCSVASLCLFGEDASGSGEFDFPQDVAVDDLGNAYVADTLNSRLQIFAPNGDFKSSWGNDVVATGPGDLPGDPYEICVPANGDICKKGVAGSGADQLGSVSDIVVAEGAGNFQEVYISGSERVVRLTSTGTFLRAWGKDVIAGNAETGFEVCVYPADTCKGGDQGDLGGEFQGVAGLAVDDLNHLYAMDVGHGRVQRFNQLSGAFQRTWGKDVDSVQPGDGPEICTVATDCQDANPNANEGGEFQQSLFITADVDNSIYVTDNNTDRVQKFTANGGFIRTWGTNVLAGNGDQGFEICTAAQTCRAEQPPYHPEPYENGEFYVPAGIAADAEKNIYVAAAHQILKFTETGQFLRSWGADVVESGPNNNPNSGHTEICINGVDQCEGDILDFGVGEWGGEFNGPRGIGIAPDGSLWTTESNPNRVQKFSDAVAGVGTPVSPASPGGATINPRQLALKKCKKKRSKPKKKKCRKKAKKLPTSAPAVPR